MRASKWWCRRARGRARWSNSSPRIGEWIDDKRAVGAARRPPPEAFPPEAVRLRAHRECWRLHLAGGTGQTAPGASSRPARGGILESRARPRPAALREALRALVDARRARARLEPRVAALAARHGVRYSKVAIRRQRSRWGSCSVRGTISLNACLLFQRPEVVDYLIVHELMHVKHMNHSARFWQAVEASLSGLARARPRAGAGLAARAALGFLRKLNMKTTTRNLPRRVDLKNEAVHWDLGTSQSYGEYLQLDKLLNAQKPNSIEQDEMLFIIVHQVSELWMRLFLHELGHVFECVRRDNLDPSFKMLARISRLQEELLGAWSVLSTLTPFEYSSFRNTLGRSSGFQSLQYRRARVPARQQESRRARGPQARPGRLRAAGARAECTVDLRRSAAAAVAPRLRHSRSRSSSATSRSRTRRPRR